MSGAGGAFGSLLQSFVPNPFRAIRLAAEAPGSRPQRKLSSVANSFVRNLIEGSRLGFQRGVGFRDHRTKCTVELALSLASTLTGVIQFCRQALVDEDARPT